MTATADLSTSVMSAPQADVDPDIANIVAWLASDEAAWATGQCFTVDGGLTAASPLRPELF